MLPPPKRPGDRPEQRRSRQEHALPREIDLPIRALRSRYEHGNGFDPTFGEPDTALREYDIHA